jgi:hypothetical protein
VREADHRDGGHEHRRGRRDPEVEGGVHMEPSAVTERSGTG